VGQKRRPPLRYQRALIILFLIPTTAPCAGFKRRQPEKCTSMVLAAWTSLSPNFACCRRLFQFPRICTLNCRGPPKSRAKIPQPPLKKRPRQGRTRTSRRRCRLFFHFVPTVLHFGGPIEAALCTVSINKFSIRPRQPAPLLVCRVGGRNGCRVARVANFSRAQRAVAIFFRFTCCYKRIVLRAFNLTQLNTDVMMTTTISLSPWTKINTMLTSGRPAVGRTTDD
jgi:hypothetical protein